MMLTVQFYMDNAAFHNVGEFLTDAGAQSAAESARILEEVARRIKHDGIDALPMSLFDRNGNRVGVAEVIR